MPNVEAKEAIKYAFSSEMLKLYGLILAADVALIIGLFLRSTWAARGGTSGLIGQVLGIILLLIGLLAGVAGLVGLIYKIIADATRE